MRVTVISSNIRFDNPADGANAWPHRRDFFVQTLMKHSPDIICTQEGRFDQLKELEALLKDFEIIDHHRSWIKERMYPCIFVRKNAFEYSQSGDLWLSETPEVAGSKSFESAFPRLMTWTRLQIRNSEKAFYIVNTHFDHIKEETRIHQMEVFTNEVKRFWDQNKSLIVTGDFNDSPDGNVRKTLIEKIPELRDAWRIFNKEEMSSHHAFSGEIQNGSRIDWIMVDQRIEVTNALMDKSVDSHGNYPSDHFPIICDLKF